MTKNFKLFAGLASVAAALLASLLVLSSLEKPAQAQAGEGENTQARTQGELDEDPKGNEIAAGELIITYTEDPSSPNVQDIPQEVGAEVEQNFFAIDAQLLSLPDVKNEGAQEAREQALEEKKDALKENPNVEAVDYNYLRNPDQAKPNKAPNDQFYGQQWGYPKINAPQAWDTIEGSAQVKVAVIDTGIDSNHPDLKGKIVAQYDFANNDATAEESSDSYGGHGTHVSGTVGANTNNGTGVAGTCPNCKIMMAKYWDDSTGGFDSEVMAGINWSVKNGAKVINMSLGGPGYSSTYESTVNKAWDKGLVLVAAMGNTGTKETRYPAAFKNIIAVGATDQNDKKAIFSTTGSHIDVAAPGVNILSTFPTGSGSYVSNQGTSMATPHVAGLAGLLASQGKTNSQIRNAIETTTVDLGTSGKDESYGTGRINAQAATGDDGGGGGGNGGGDSGGNSSKRWLEHRIDHLQTRRDQVQDAGSRRHIGMHVSDLRRLLRDLGTQQDSSGSLGAASSEEWLDRRIDHLQTRRGEVQDANTRRYIAMHISDLRHLRAQQD